MLLYVDVAVCKKEMEGWILQWVKQQLQTETGKNGHLEPLQMKAGRTIHNFQKGKPERGQGKGQLKAVLVLK